VKVELALARGKHYADKRSDIKARDERREIERTLRRR
jgi:tmRNA-binding protein